MKSKNVVLNLVVFFLLIAPISLADDYKFVGEHMFKKIGEKQPIIVVMLPPDLYYQSNYKETWNEVYHNISSIEKFSKSLDKTVLSRFRDLSIPSVVKQLNLTIWREGKSYVKIEVPNESYKEIIEIFKGLGLRVRDNFGPNLHLSQSREIIGLPYIYSCSEELTGSSRIAILDTGVDTNHPDLPWGTKVIFWNDTLRPPGDPNHLTNPADPDGHGTHVCSIAAGTGVNSNGLYKGIAPNASLLVWRVCEESCDFGAIGDAIEQATDRNVNVISMSLGSNPQIWNTLFSRGVLHCSFADACSGNCHVEPDIQETIDAITMAISSNIPVIASAGNEGAYPSTIDFPACLRDVIAVGASYKQDYSIYTENFGSIDEKENVSLHVIISVTSDNPQKIYEEYFNASWRWNGNYNDWWEYGLARFVPTGIQKVIKPDNWPATLRVQIEGEHKHRDCYQAERAWWDPGIKDKGDEYWTWEQTFVSNLASPYIVVDVSALANGARGGDFSCLFDTVDWYKAYYNTYTCEGTALSCNSFDPTDKNGCKNQLGCSWCGCWVWTLYPLLGYCKDVPIQDCLLYSPSEWRGCEGTATPCADRHQDEGEICGSPSTTGCTASWDTYWTNVKIYRTDALSLKGLPTFYSSRGPSVFGIEPDVTAPGHEICAARAAGTGDTESLICGNNNYIAYSGTSMAAPMVAGEIALMVEGSATLGLNPSVWDIRQGVMEANEKVFAGDPDNEEGYGIINVQKAVDFITNCSLKYKDGWYCNGNVREYRDFYYDSSSGACTYSVTQSENCNNYDGWQCSGTNRCGSSTGDTREYWDYYCSKGNCIYSITSSSNCRCDAYDSDGGLAFTTAGTCTDYKGCSGGNCQSTGYTDTCIDSTTLKEYYVSGSGDSATCSYTTKNCLDYGSGYTCFYGRCLSPPSTEDCRAEGGRCMSGSGGCINYCKREGSWGYCELADPILGYYPGCSPGDCCCFCA